MVPAEIRTGLVGEIDTADVELATVETVLALMRLFTREALDVAARYVRGKNLQEVGCQDMRNSLMYCARTFFSQDNVVLQQRIQDEIEIMKQEEEEEEGGEEGKGEEEEQGAEGGQESEAPSERQLVKHVDAICRVWHLWKPVDPVHVLIKKAIDDTEW